MQGRWRALAILTAARTSLGLQFQSISSVSPMLLDDVGLHFADLGTLIGLYFLPGVFVAVPAGALGARFGDKRVVVAGLVLMTAGGVLTALAGGFTGLAVGRVLSGLGAILLNVAMSKMVTDWFAGREIVLAMSIFVNSFPVGLGLALMTLGPLASVAGWPAGLLAAALFAFAAMVLVALAYERHPNDAAAQDAKGLRIASLAPAEIVLVCVAGAIWGIYNGGFAVMFGFAPTFLASIGYATAQVGVLIASATWLAVLSVQVGGGIAHRWGHAGALMGVGIVAWSACLVAFAQGGAWVSPALVAGGLLMGLPAGVIMSLPAQALRPEHRAVGMGLFYLWLYIGHGLLPPLAGWLQDRLAHPNVALYATAAIVLAILPLYASFVSRVRTAGPQAAVRPAA